MRYELTDFEWTAIRPFLPNKPRGVPRVNDRRVLNGIFWIFERFVTAIAKAILSRQNVLAAVTDALLRAMERLSAQII
jgi:hypothetical protein